jgi:hypothetical protein
METSPGGGGAGSDKKGARGGPARAAQSCLPVTLKQLTTASLDGDASHYRIDGRDVTLARVVARVVRVDSSAASTNVWLNDGTAPDCMVQCYAEDSAYYTDRLSSWQGNPLVEAVLQVKVQGGGMFLTIVSGSCAPLKEGNALTHHLLDVANQHLVATRGALPRTGAASSSSSSAAAAAMQATMLGFGAGAGGSAGAGISGDKEAVLNQFREGSSDASSEGTTVDAVLRALQAQPATRHITGAQIATFAEQLLEEGHIYSTCDEMTFKTTA